MINRSPARNEMIMIGDNGSDFVFRRLENTPPGRLPTGARHQLEQSQQVPGEELLELTNNLKINDDNDHHREPPPFSSSREQLAAFGDNNKLCELGERRAEVERSRKEVSRREAGRMQQQQQQRHHFEQLANDDHLMLVPSSQPVEQLHQNQQQQQQLFGGQPTGSGSGTGAALAQPLADHYANQYNPLVAGQPFQFANYASYHHQFDCDYTNSVYQEASFCGPDYQTGSGAGPGPEPAPELLELSSRPKELHYSFAEEPQQNLNLNQGHQNQKAAYAQLPESVIRVNSFNSLDTTPPNQQTSYYSQPDSNQQHRKCEFDATNSFAANQAVHQNLAGSGTSYNSHNYSQSGASSGYQPSQPEIDIGQASTSSLVDTNGLFQTSCASSSSLHLLNAATTSGSGGSCIQANQNQLLEPDLRVCEWEDCERTFMEMGKFVKHLEEDHVNQSPKIKNRYFCLWSKCKRNQQEFNARYKLLIHMRVHSGEKPYPCNNENCKKSFSRLENLKIHVRSHTGEKPYKCNYPGCNKSFTNSSDRIKHHKTHRDPKPYACSQTGCSKRYTDPSSLRKHLRAHKRLVHHHHQHQPQPNSNSEQNLSANSNICRQLAGSASFGSYSSDYKQPAAGSYQQTLPLPVERDQVNYGASIGVAPVQADFDPASILETGQQLYQQEEEGEEWQQPAEEVAWTTACQPNSNRELQHDYLSRSWCAGANQSNCCQVQEPLIDYEPAHFRQQHQDQNQQLNWRSNQQQLPGQDCWQSREQQHNELMRSLPVTSSSRQAHFRRIPQQQQQQHFQRSSYEL